MADHTAIEWTDATWNPITGCSVVSPGCTNCYAMKLAGSRLKHHPSRGGLTKDSKAGPVWTGEVRLNDEVLDQPIGWRRPRRIFVCAHGDLFHESVHDDWIDRVFAVMTLAPQHTYQVLTKRPDRMQQWFAQDRLGFIEGRAKRMLRQRSRDAGKPVLVGKTLPPFPWPHVWLGVSIEDQARADLRIPHLLGTPAAVRFVSLEPLLGPINLEALRPDVTTKMNALTGHAEHLLGDKARTDALDWVIVGGESGPDARPMHPDWVRQLRDQCVAAGVPFFFKQWGAWAHQPERAHFKELAAESWQRVASDMPNVRPALMFNIGKKAAGALLDGREWREMPR